ncbi:MAG: DUF177 domain-containing protein [Ignavibacteriae bacterium]|nr:DUF177 domain-containing protein [Ignavibacteriota bacterium]
MIINISNLKEGQHSFVFTVTGKELELTEFVFLNDIKVTIDLYKTHNQVVLKIHLDSVVKLPCDRCLEDFEFIIDSDFELIYKSSYDKNEIDEEDDELNDFKVIPADVHNISLNKEIRDYVLLSFPLKRTPEVEDDICLFCRKNINDILKVKKSEEINPVWEKLLKNKKN